MSSCGFDLSKTFSKKRGGNVSVEFRELSQSEEKKKPSLPASCTFFVYLSEAQCLGPNPLSQAFFPSSIPHFLFTDAPVAHTGRDKPTAADWL